MRIREESQQVIFFRSVQINLEFGTYRSVSPVPVSERKLAGAKGQSGKAVAVDAFGISGVVDRV
jgi:hypothetical protein